MKAASGKSNVNQKIQQEYNDNRGDLLQVAAQLRASGQIQNADKQALIKEFTKRVELVISSKVEKQMKVDGGFYSVGDMTKKLQWSKRKT